MNDKEIGRDIGIAILAFFGIGILGALLAIIRGICLGLGIETGL